MAFQLRQKSQGKLLTVYHLLDGQGNIVGSANIRNSEVSDFLRSWQESTDAQQAKAAVSRSNDTNAFVAALMRNKTPMSRAALLRS